jgi:alkaline phosphatase
MWTAIMFASVLEIAKGLGKAMGAVSDTRLTYASPAAFASHQPHRSLENQIAEDMLATRIDIMLSVGLRYWIPMSANEVGAVSQNCLKKQAVILK